MWGRQINGRASHVDLPIVYAMGDYDGGDESETSTEQELRQKNVGSGDSTNNNCAANAHEAGADVECFNEEEETAE